MRLLPVCLLFASFTLCACVAPASTSDTSSNSPAPIESSVSSSPVESLSEYDVPETEPFVHLSIVHLGSEPSGSDQYSFIHDEEGLETYLRGLSSSSKKQKLENSFSRLPDDFFTKRDLLISKEIDLNYSADSLSYSSYEYLDGVLTAYFEYVSHSETGGAVPAVSGSALDLFAISKEAKLTDFRISVR